MKDHHIELLQREIDGLNSDEDSAQLHVLLESDAELKTAFDELRAVQTAFSAYVEKEPSPELKRAIMRALPDQVSVKAVNVAWWAGIVEQFRAPRPVTLAYAFSVGLVIAFAVSMVLTPVTGFDGGDAVVGTMSDFPRLESMEATTYPISGDGITGTVLVGRSAQTAVVKFVWESEQPVEATIEFKASEMSIVRTQSLGTPRNFRTSMSQGTFKLEGSGSIDEIVSFSLSQSEGGSLDIIIRSEGVQIFEQSEAPSAGFQN